MNGPQGHATYGGVQVGLQRFQFTRTAGISPNVATITVARELFERNRWPIEGDVNLTYDGERIRIKKCRLDSARLTADASGNQLVEMRIMDRRWLWRECGKISGVYNARKGSEEILIPETEKKPKELAELCLKEMGETGYDVSAMSASDNSRPFIEWDYHNPAEALASLCDQLGYRPTINLNDKVEIVKVGEGKQLPDGEIFGDASIDPPDLPGEIIIVGDRTHYQIDVDLYPVALDTDGEIKPVDDVSYAPRDGWSTWSDFEFFWGLSSSRTKELAQQWVYRAYRIQVPFTLPNGEEVKELKRVLPLLGQQVDYDILENVKRFREPWVYGNFDKSFEGRPPEPLTADDKRLRERPDSIYRRGFSVDAELGIVRFGDTVWLYSDGLKVVPAQIKLRIAVCLRADDTRGWTRYEFSKKPDGGKKGAIGTKKVYLRRDEIRLNHWEQFDTPGAGKKDNKTECDKRAEYYYDAALAKYKINDPGTRQYAGFVAHELDGAIEQVTWMIDDSGHCFTVISRNKEEPDYVLPYAEKRMLERQRELAHDLAKPAITRAEDIELTRFIA